MHKLPAADSPLRQLFDVADVVAIATGELPVHVMPNAMYAARRMVREDKAVRAVVFFGVCASDDTLCLYRVGARGGFKRLWVFGLVGRKARLA